MTCTEPCCDRPTRARGLCGSCYKRHWRTGTLPAIRPNTGRAPTPIRERLASRVADLDVALAITHHHAGMLLERWGQMTSAQLHEHLLLLWQESAAGAVPDAVERAS